MQITQPFNRFGIAVIQKTALRTVQRGDHGHVLGVEREAEHVEILRDALRVHRLGNADHTALNQPATVFLYRAATASRTSFENSPFLPSAKGAHDSICTPFVRMNSAAAVCWWNGWVST